MMTGLWQVVVDDGQFIHVTASTRHEAILTAVRLMLDGEAHYKEEVEV
jgi:hypothetical protein